MVFEKEGLKIEYKDFLTYKASKNIMLALSGVDLKNPSPDILIKYNDALIRELTISINGSQEVDKSINELDNSIVAEYLVVLNNIYTGEGKKNN
jgi:hypothetical protein